MGMTQDQMIERAWARAEALRLTVYRVRFDEKGAYIPVQSQREDHPDQRVRMTPDGPQCGCEAMEYKRVPVCVHILTVALRAQRAKKRGSRATARQIMTIYSQPLTMR